jgi:hypothetical protein
MTILPLDCLTYGEDGSLLLEVRVEVLVAEPCLRCVERRVEEFEARGLRKGDQIKAGDGVGDR